MIAVLQSERLILFESCEYIFLEQLFKGLSIQDYVFSVRLSFHILRKTNLSHVIYFVLILK